MKTSPYEALIKARAIIADPTRFTRSHAARCKAGYEGDPGDPTSPLSHLAVRFDASGALMRATQRRKNCPGFSDLVDAAGSFRAFVEITTRGSHADTLALYDKAIAKYTQSPTP